MPKCVQCDNEISCINCEAFYFLKSDKTNCVSDCLTQDLGYYSLIFLIFIILKKNSYF